VFAYLRSTLREQAAAPASVPRAPAVEAERAAPESLEAAAPKLEEFDYDASLAELKKMFKFSDEVIERFQASIRVADFSDMEEDEGDGNQN
jgi:hypothetical protein